MNIVYHHRTQGTGAEGVHIGHVIKGLRTIGHDVKVISPNNEDPTKTGGNNPYESKQSVKAKALHLLSRKLPQALFELLEILYNLTAIRQLKKAVSESNVDFIYERNAFFLYAGAKISKKYAIPLIIEVNEVVGESRVRGQKFVKLAQKIEKYAFEQADAIIVVSNFLKQKIANLGVSEAKIHVIPNAADESIFAPDNCDNSVRDSLAVEDTSIIIGFIGWFVAWHNFELLVNAIAILNRSHPTYLMLVGDGELKHAIIDQAKQLGCEQRLIFSGAVKHKEMPNYIQAMDICVIPGSNPYRSPIKLFEYMAMAKPTLAPALEPIEFVSQHEVNAMHFEPENLDSLVAQAEKLADSKELRDEIGTNARNTIMSKHLWIHNSERVIDIYNAIVTQKRSSHPE